MDILFFFNIALFLQSLGSKLAAAHQPPHFSDRNLVEPTCFAWTMRKGGRRSAHLALLGLLPLPVLLSQASSFINPPRSAGRTGGCGMMRADWGCTMHAPLVTRWLMMFPQDAAQSLDHGHKSHAEAYSWNSSCTWGDVRQTSTID